MRFALLILLALGAAVGCQPARQESRPPEGKLRVLATTGMVADIVREVGGEQVEVTQLMGAGVDPHLYKTSRDDVQRILDADVVFYSGLMLEGKMSDTLVQVARKKPVVAVTEQIDPASLLEPAQMQGHYDPHVWMDVAAWAKCVDVVAETLAAERPQHTGEFASAADEYRQQLAALDDYAKRAIASIPEQRRVLVTSHDAFNYFGRAYGLEVEGVQGISTESEAGLQRINALVDMLAKRDVAAVFVESSVSGKSIEALIDGAAANGHTVRIGGELYSDAMGPADTYEGTYIGMIDHNVTLVTRGLGGDAPERGMSDRLNAVGNSP